VAVVNQDVRLAAELLKGGASARAHDNHRSTPLHIAAQNSDVSSLTELLESGAAPNAATLARRTALHFTRTIEVFETLLCVPMHVRV